MGKVVHKISLSLVASTQTREVVVPPVAQRCKGIPVDLPVNLSNGRVSDAGPAITSARSSTSGYISMDQIDLTPAMTSPIDPPLQKLDAVMDEIQQRCSSAEPSPSVLSRLLYWSKPHFDCLTILYTCHDTRAKAQMQQVLRVGLATFNDMINSGRLSDNDAIKLRESIQAIEKVLHHTSATQRVLMAVVGLLHYVLPMYVASKNISANGKLAFVVQAAFYSKDALMLLAKVASPNADAGHFVSQWKYRLLPSMLFAILFAPTAGKATSVAHSSGAAAGVVVAMLAVYNQQSLASLLDKIKHQVLSNHTNAPEAPNLSQQAQASLLVQIARRLEDCMIEIAKANKPMSDVTNESVEKVNQSLNHLVEHLRKTMDTGNTNIASSKNHHQAAKAAIALLTLATTTTLVALLFASKDFPGAGDNAADGVLVMSEMLKGVFDPSVNVQGMVSRFVSLQGLTFILAPIFAADLATGFITKGDAKALALAATLVTVLSITLPAAFASAASGVGDAITRCRTLPLQNPC